MCCIFVAFNYYGSLDLIPTCIVHLWDSFVHEYNYVPKKIENPQLQTFLSVDTVKLQHFKEFSYPFP